MDDADGKRDSRGSSSSRAYNRGPPAPGSDLNRGPGRRQGGGGDNDDDDSDEDLLRV